MSQNLQLFAAGFDPESKANKMVFVRGPVVGSILVNLDPIIRLPPLLKTEPTPFPQTPFPHPSERKRC